MLLCGLLEALSPLLPRRSLVPLIRFADRAAACAANLNIPLFKKRFELPSSVLRSIPCYAPQIEAAHSNRDSTHLVASQNHVL